MSMSQSNLYEYLHALRTAPNINISFILDGIRHAVNSTPNGTRGYMRQLVANTICDYHNKNHEPYINRGSTIRYICSNMFHIFTPKDELNSQDHIVMIIDYIDIYYDRNILNITLNYYDTNIDLHVKNMNSPYLYIMDMSTDILNSRAMLMFMYVARYTSTDTIKKIIILDNRNLVELSFTNCEKNELFQTSTMEHTYPYLTNTVFSKRTIATFG